MTKFLKTNFTFDSMYLHYVKEDGQKIFIARFKHRTPGCGRAVFQKFLIANFTVEEYEAALKNSAPLTVLDSKGFDSIGRILATKPAHIREGFYARNPSLVK